ncbi:hypothetical protein [Paenibacillus kobensis]|uniref:hypothetical protein n=1 Tax=Paenibacillus kobensis TaxID=59841 RepID=UPI000FDAE0FE|nr:hypothetical protein [Paenibacillus kobensis]
MKKITTILVACLLLLSAAAACSNKQEIKRDKLYHFSGVVTSVVKANGKSTSDIKERFYLTLDHFYPAGKPFETYNGMFNDASTDVKNNRYISITDNTRIYKFVVDGIKEEITAAELEKNRDKTVEFWVFPYGNMLEAMEIDLLNK